MLVLGCLDKYIFFFKSLFRGERVGCFWMCLFVFLLSLDVVGGLWDVVRPSCLVGYVGFPRFL